jgi:hypothetical protein
VGGGAWVVRVDAGRGGLKDWEEVVRVAGAGWCGWRLGVVRAIRTGNGELGRGLVVEMGAGSGVHLRNFLGQFT